MDLEKLEEQKSFEPENANANTNNQLELMEDQTWTPSLSENREKPRVAWKIKFNPPHPIKKEERMKHMTVFRFPPTNSFVLSTEA